MMTLAIHLIVQTAATAVQTLNAFGVFGHEHQTAVATVIGVLQGGAGSLAHHFNTDGTPQEIPFLRKQP